MIGGKIIDIRNDGDRVRIWCVDTYDHSGDAKVEIYDECGIYIAPDGELPALGDTVWWQGKIVYWTPADCRFVDRPLQKLGYSSSSRDMLIDTIRHGKD
jgi:hypothetical protein